MNYSGRFDATHLFDGPGQHSPADVHIDSFSLRGHGSVPSGAFVVPDPDLLFNGDFRRSGVDLILSKAGREFVLQDYFKGEKRAAIASPDGAHLTGDIVNALAGTVEYSQAAPGAGAGQVIGHVTKLTGSASAIRNGVSITLNQGDNVEKGDVVQSGSDSTLGITFVDGTVFGLSANARMVLNEMVYDPNGSSNSSLMSLVAGTITFVAGETAKHGDMKIDTPVATMGIRGTAVLTKIDFIIPQGGGDPQPEADFQVLVEPDGSTGSYILFDKATLLPIATVNQAGQQIHISGGNVTVSNALLSPDVQKLILDVFSLKFTDNSNNNTKLTYNSTDTITPDSNGLVIKTAAGAVAIPTFVNLVNNSNGPGSTQDPPPNLNLRVPGPPQAVVVNDHGQPATAFSTSELVNKTGDSADLDTVTGGVNFLDFNLGDRPTVKVNVTSFTYQDAAHKNVTASLTAQQLADIAATEIKIKVVPDPGNTNNGSAAWTYSVPDSAFDFLAAGEVLTLTYTVRVDNNFTANNETTFIPITIKITGTNDVPVITTSVPTIEFLGGTSVPGGPLSSSEPTSGTLTFTDVDLTDTHTVSVALTSADLPGGTVPPGPLAIFEKALSVSLATDSTGTGAGTVNWALADLPVYLADIVPKGETLTLTYTVTVTDLQGATSTQTITVTIKGTDTAAEVWIATTQSGSPPGGLWKDGVNWETGVAPTINDDVIIITDQLHGLTPSYPVTIDDTYSASAPASAKSVTMNDFGSSPPELVNLGWLTIAAGLNLSADSIVENSGTMSVGGKAEILNHSVLQNSGTITLAGGGDFKDQSSITNAATGKIEMSGGTLNVFVDITNAGLIQVDAGATLVLDPSGIQGGTVTIAGTLALEGGSFLGSGKLTNTGQVDVSGTGNVFDAELVTNTGAGAIDISGALTLKDASSISNGATNGETVEVDASLTLQDTSCVTGGILTNQGTLNLDGTSALKNGALANSGQVNVIGAGNAFDGEAVTNRGGGAIDIAGLLTLLNAASIGNDADSGETVENGASLTLQDSSFIAGGTITNQGTLNLKDASALKSGVLTNGGQINVAGAGVVLDAETVTNNSTIDIIGLLTLKNAASIANGSNGSATVEQDASLTLSDTSFISGGKLINSGDVYVEASSGAKLDGVNVDNSGGTIHVDHPGNSAELILDDGTTISNGTLAIGQLGTLDVPTAAGATLSGVAVNLSGLGAVQVESGSQLILDNTTVSGGTLIIAGTLDSIGTTFISGATINNIANIEVTAGTLTIDPTPITNAGTILVTNDSTLVLSDDVVTNGVINSITNAVTDGTIQVDATDSTHFSTLDLAGSTIDGGIIRISGLLVSGGDSVITGAALANAGTIDVTGGTLTIDATSIVTNTGLIEAAGGKLIIDTGVSGNLEIKGASILELGANEGFYSQTTVTFQAGSTGTLVLDQAAPINGGSGLAVAGLDDNWLDFHNIVYSSKLTVSYAGDATGGVLSMYVNGSDVADLKLTGDYLGVHWVLADDGSPQHGTTIAEVPGAISGLDANGNAVENVTLTASITDGGRTVTGATYHWLISADGIHWSDASGVNGGASYTPVQGDEGKLLKVDVSFTDSANNIETSTVFAGTVQEGPTNDLVATLDAGTAQQGQTIHVTGVTDGGIAVSTGLICAWQVSSDGGHTWTTVGSNSSFTPGEAQEGKLLQLVVTYADATGSESSTYGLGTVAESATGDLVATLDAGTAQQGQTIHITGVTDGGIAVSTGLIYAWQVSSDGGHTWTTVGSNSSFTPGEAEEGKLLQLVVTYADATGSESSTYGLGTVAESASGDLVATLDAGTAQQSQTIHVTGVTDGGIAVSTGLIYAWQVSSDGGHAWTTVGSNSSFTPGEAEEGKLLQLVVTYADATGSESLTYGLGTVAESASGDLVATLDAGTAQQGQTIHVTGVTDGGKAVSTGLIYAWQVSSDGGHTWTTVGSNSSFTPGEAQEGKLLQLVVTYTDAAGSESATYSLGMPNDIVATLDASTAQQGETIHVTGVTDGGSAVSTGLSYAWQVSSDGGHAWTTVGSSSSYTPSAADAGEWLQVVVTYTDSGETESAVDSLGIVAPAKEWLGGTHPWETAAQWSPAGVPTSGDNVVVDASGTYTLTIDQVSVAQSVIVNAGGAKVDITDDGTLTLGGNLILEAGVFQVDPEGTLKVIASSAKIAGSFADNGTVEASGGTLEVASATVSGTGAFKIDAGATLQLDHGSAHNVVFAGSGELILKDPAHFSGTISDSGGSMTAADVLDLAGFDTDAKVSYSGTTSGGTVTVTEANHANAVIHVGANSTHWSAPANDGHGGILIHDPPDAGGTQAGYSELFSAMGLRGNDSFVFSRMGPLADHVPEIDQIQIGQPTYARMATQGTAYGDHDPVNMVIAPDTDAANLHNILKIQVPLHQGDFHFV